MHPKSCRKKTSVAADRVRKVQPCLLVHVDPPTTSQRAAALLLLLLLHFFCPVVWIWGKKKTTTTWSMDPPSFFFLIQFGSRTDWEKVVTHTHTHTPRESVDTRCVRAFFCLIHEIVKSLRSEVVVVVFFIRLSQCSKLFSRPSRPDNKKPQVMCCWSHYYTTLLVAHSFAFHDWP